MMTSFLCIRQKETKLKQIRGFMTFAMLCKFQLIELKTAVAMSWSVFFTFA